MYFQVCSNSAYPQHSGERYRANGPLVFFSVGLAIVEVYPLFRLLHCKHMEPYEQNIWRTASATIMVFGI